MAQNDWQYNYTSLSGDSQGIAVFHSSLSNPLTNEQHGVGTYCRRFSVSNWSSADDPRFFIRTKNPNLINVPDTKAISIRAWLRAGFTANNRSGHFGLVAKATSDASNPSGYYFNFHNNGTLYLNGSACTFPQGFSSSSWNNTWVHMRLDVIPIKHNGVVIMDHLKGFLEVNGEWVLVGEKYNEATDSNFISWTGTRYNGFEFWYDNYYDGGTHYLWVDKVQMYLEDVEQPERLVLSLANDTGPSDQDNITSDPSLTVSAAEIGATVSFSTDGINWQSTIPAAVSGENTVYARQVSAEGRTSPLGQITFTYVAAGDAPVFTSLTASSVVENGGENQVVYSAVATSQITDVIYSLKQVDDYQDFSIGLNNGQVLTLSSLDYEAKNAYNFTVIATDLAGHAVERSVELSVLDSNESPSFSLALSLGTEASPLSEDAAIDTVVGTLSFSDPEGDNLSFSIDTQTVEGTFAISGQSLVLTSSLNYESAAQHTLQISANDGVNTVTQSYVVKVADVNEAPTFSFSPSLSPVSEDTAVGTVVGTLSGTDPDGDALTFSIVSQTVADMFAIDGTNLVLNGVLDYETNTSHEVVVRVSDGQLSSEQTLTIQVADANEAPSNLQVSSLTIDDGLQAGSVVLTLSADDQDSGDTLSYSLVAGSGDADNSKFEVSGSSLKILEATDLQVSGSYNIRLAATDQGGLSTEEPFVLQVSSSS